MHQRCGATSGSAFCSSSSNILARHMQIISGIFLLFQYIRYFQNFCFSLFAYWSRRYPTFSRSVPPAGVSIGGWPANSRRAVLYAFLTFMVCLPNFLLLYRSFLSVYPCCSEIIHSWVKGYTCAGRSQSEITRH